MLTSDLIAYLRDLLVYKVKPEALAQDTSPELQKSLESQAAMIEMDRLLELIDQFAAAEARMKWAPNKKLHLEVAVIKAIQTLSQVTLNEVIENLSALRDGSAKGGQGKPAVARPPVSTTTPSLARSKPGGPSSAEKPLQSNTAKVAEDPNEQLSIDFEAAWQGVVAAARARRPLIRTWIEQAKALGVEGRFFLLGFPPEHKSVMESLARPANREFLEALLKEQTGRELSLKLSVKEGLVASPSPVEDEIAPTPPAKKSAPRAEFKDDPLIREALEIFKGEIKPVTD